VFVPSPCLPSGRNTLLSTASQSLLHPSPTFSQVVAEWELFLLTSVGYSPQARREARSKLDAIHTRDAARLAHLHAEVQAVLGASMAVPTPTPLPTPSPVLPMAGEGGMHPALLKAALFVSQHATWRFFTWMCPSHQHPHPPPPTPPHM
jgi:hypothetical protein